ncbi:Noc2p family-domain-containing protein [Apiosordaria backusii]|uniref:Noc2p family-domain-containing protein n=1 Tax=Apiosordaria backusii TaxID=314023 RepID=A0AA40EYK7_9PEZI|nr:Noc2p family-domain-containing protein [Apiosordaria backusii]
MGTSKKNAKATKKFEQKHLGAVLERRKATAKIKQRQQIKDKKQAKRAKDDEFFKGPDGEVKKRPSNKKPGTQGTEMSVDDFFKGGFEILDKKQNGKAAALGKRKRGEANAREETSDQSEGSDVDVSDNEEDMVTDSEAGFSDDDEEEDLGMSKNAMAALAEKDPEFYKFLKENDPEALDFDENASLDEIDELSGSDEEDEQPKKKQKKSKKGSKEEDEADDDAHELTKAMVAKWEKALIETKSLKAAKQTVIAFRCAAHLNEEDEENPQRYSIKNPEVFHNILMVSLKLIPEVLNHHLPVKESAAGKVYVQTETKKFKTLSNLIKSFAASIIRLLGTLSDDATVKLTLNALQPLLPYLLSFRKLLKVLIKTIVAFWSQPASSDSTRITAFLVIRRLMVVADKGVREAVLKATYRGLFDNSKHTNHNTIQGINLMKNSAAELWGLDQALGYTTAFTSIRQLAIHLRNSIVNNKQVHHIYNWQFVHALDFWSCVLAEHCSPLKEAEAGKESQLKLLIYPLVQVTLGVLRLIPTALYFPLRFQLIRSLLRLSRATDTYIPSPLPSWKSPKSYLRTRVYQDGVGDQVVELLSEFFVLWSKSIAFPEFSLPVIISLKRWLKESRKRSTGNKNGKLGGSLVLLVQKLEANAKFIEEKRAKVEFAPKDRAQVDAFLKDLEWERTPVGAFVVGQRKLREEKRKVMEEARKAEEGKRREEEREANEGREGGDSDEGEEDDEEEDEMELDEEEEEEEEEESEEEDEEEGESE